MYCGKCGRLLPSSATVCSKCGTPIDVVTPVSKPFQTGSASHQRPAQPQPPQNPQQFQNRQQPQYQQPQYQQAQKPAEKKKTPIWATLVVIVVMFAVGGLVGKLIAGTYQTPAKEETPAVTIPRSEPNMPAATTPATTPETEPTPAANPAYEQIFTSRGIIEPIHFAVGDTAAFAKVEGNNVARLFYVSSNEIVQEYYEEIWIWDPNATDDLVQQQVNGLHDLHQNSSFATFKGELLRNGYMYFEIHFADLSKPENVRTLLEILGLEPADALSMKIEEKALIDGGYIKK